MDLTTRPHSHLMEPHLQLCHLRWHGLAKASPVPLLRQAMAVLAPLFPARLHSGSENKRRWAHGTYLHCSCCSLLAWGRSALCFSPHTRPLLHLVRWWGARSLPIVGNSILAVRSDSTTSCSSTSHSSLILHPPRGITPGYSVIATRVKPPPSCLAAYPSTMVRCISSTRARSNTPTYWPSSAASSSPRMMRRPQRAIPSLTPAPGATTPKFRSYPSLGINCISACSITCATCWSN